MARNRTKAKIMSVVEALEKAAKDGKRISDVIAQAKRTDNSLNTQFIPDIANAMGIPCKDVKSFSKIPPRNGQRTRLQSAFTTVSTKIRAQLDEDNRAPNKSGSPKKRKGQYSHRAPARHCC